MTPLAKALDRYLIMRRALGFKLHRASTLLPDFVDWMDRRGACVVTRDLALAWAMSPPGARSAWWVTRLGEVRGFARYLHGLEPRTQVPPPGMLFGRYPRTTPYLYSRGDMAQLFSAARHLCAPFRAATVSTLLGLLRATGLRPGEAIRLERDHVDFGEGVLLVERTKFEKSREVPVHPTTTAALRRYAEQRDRRFSQPRARTFFLSMAGTALVHSNLVFAFRRLLRATGVGRDARRRPRLHDFRHTFAVTTLLGWYRKGSDVDARLPLLSTYLGHVDPAATYWYLSASPELMALAARRLERATGGRR